MTQEARLRLMSSTEDLAGGRDAARPRAEPRERTYTAAYFM
jgi:hypothetical protein